MKLSDPIGLNDHCTIQFLVHRKPHISKIHSLKIPAKGNMRQAWPETPRLTEIGCLPKPGPTLASKIIYPRLTTLARLLLHRQHHATPHILRPNTT